MRRATILIALATITMLTGCTRLRLVMDLVPAEDALTETIVLQDERAGWRAAKIAMVDVTGLLMDGRRPGFPQPGENPVADYVEALRKAEADPRVRAVVVRINSPGGTVTASDVLHRETTRFRAATGKPVVILMGDLGTSGGYYLACAGDTIIAHPTTITGSVGVIIQTFNVSEGMRRIGVRADAFTSGPNKAAGSPFEPMEPGHRTIFQGLVTEFFDGFVDIVRAARPELTQNALSEILDGRVVTGRRALELGLIDHLGDLHDAFRIAKDAAEIDRAILVKYHRPLEHIGSAYAQSPTPSGATQVNLLQLNFAGAGLLEAPGFYYLWDPAAFSPH